MLKCYLRPTMTFKVMLTIKMQANRFHSSMKIKSFPLKELMRSWGWWVREVNVKLAPYSLFVMMFGSAVAVFISKGKSINKGMMICKGKSNNIKECNRMSNKVSNSNRMNSRVMIRCYKSSSRMWVYKSRNKNKWNVVAMSNVVFLFNLFDLFDLMQ